MDAAAQIKELEARAESLKKFQAQLEKKQAVNQHKMTELVEELDTLGVDIEGKKLPEIKEMLQEAEEKLSSDVAALEAVVKESEALVQEYEALP